MSSSVVDEEKGKYMGKEIQTTDLSKVNLDELNADQLRELLNKISNERDTILDGYDSYKKVADPQVNEFLIRSEFKNGLEKWQTKFTFKARMMTLILSYKDTGSRITNETISNALDNILKVADEANKLNADQTEIHFADADMDIKDVSILDIFQGAFLINEISDDFETLYSRRYFPTSVLPLGYSKGTKMPTYRMYEESMHIIKAMFKYMKETYVSLSSLHSTSNVANVMKECAHKGSDNKFRLARRSNSDVYFIPYYVEELNDSLTWKHEYYNDYATIYIDEYFSKFVYPILKGKRD